MSQAASAILGSSADLRVHRIAVGSADEASLRAWKEFAEASPAEHPSQDPDWVRGYFKEDVPKISTYLVQDASGSVRGSASFLAKPWPLKLYLGELTVAEMPLRRLRLLGGAPAIPEDEKLYDLLFQDLATNASFDAIHLAQVRVDSAFWKYLASSRLIRRVFAVYQPESKSLHPRLRFGSSFEEYMKTNFSKTHRHTLRRKVSRFQEEAPGPVRLIRYTEPGEVAPFLEYAVKVSRQTYQWNLHQRGLRETARFERRYGFAAERGWFRSYVLFCGETPVAFLGGYQWRGRYYTDEIGFDPAYSKNSPGTVLQMMAIQDMFAFDKPELIDFGSYDRYKEEFSNDNYNHCDLILFRRRPYCFVTRELHRGCGLATRAAVRVLHALRLKGRIKKSVRERSIDQASGRDDARQ